ncbi:MAG: MFS transporter [Candidatus Moraniibacteriota bacterium]
MLKHKEHLDRKKIRIIALISFLLGFSDAVLLYVISTYFKVASGTENIGGFYILSYVTLLLLLLNLHKLTRRLGSVNIFFLALFSKIIIIAVLAGTQPGFLGVFLLMLYILFAGIEWVSLDALLENFSRDNESGRIRGKHLAILNAGFLLGPFLSTRLLEYFGFSGIFFFLLTLNMIIFVTSLIRLRAANSVFKRDLSVFKLIRKVLERKNVLAIYYIAVVLDFFYALMIIYAPIYLLDLGLGWDKIGIIFTIMLLPFVLLQYPMGVLADKKVGEKKLLFLALLIMASCTLVFYFTHSQNILVWAVVLFGTRVGASMLEVLRDSYFYKRIDGDDMDLIDFFRTAMPVGYILAALASLVLLLFLPLKWVFVLLALVTFSALIPALRLTEIRVVKK